MRASQSIVAGRFCGGEIEPGTFHRDFVQRFDGGILTVSPSHCQAASGCPAVGAVSGDAVDPSLAIQPLEVPARA